MLNTGYDIHSSLWSWGIFLIRSQLAHCYRKNVSILGYRELSANIDFLQINIAVDYKDIYLAISIMHSSLNLDLYILTRYAKQAGFFWYQPKEIKHLNYELDDRELLFTQGCDLLKLKYIFVSHNSAMILLCYYLFKGYL